MRKVTSSSSVESTILIGNRMKNTEALIEAFKKIETHELVPNTIICTMCGCVISKDTKFKEEVCEHLKSMGVL